MSTSIKQPSLKNNIKRRDSNDDFMPKKPRVSTSPVKSGKG